MRLGLFWVCFFGVLGGGNLCKSLQRIELGSVWGFWDWVCFARKSDGFFRFLRLICVPRARVGRIWVRGLGGRIQTR